MLHHKSTNACGGDNSCSANFDTVMVLDTYSFCTFQLVFSTPPTSLHGFEWNLAGMLHHKSTNACGEIIHVRPILTELWSFSLRIFTHFSLSSQLLLHPCIDLNENLAGMLYHKSRNACGEIIHVRQILAELWPLLLTIFTHFSLSSQLLLHPCMDLNETWQGCCTTGLQMHLGR